MQISTHAQIGAAEIDALYTLSDMECVIQSAIDAATAEKDRRIRELEGNIENARKDIDSIAGADDLTHDVRWCADTAALAISALKGVE